MLSMRTIWRIRKAWYSRASVGRQIHLAQARRRIARRVGHQFHDQRVVEVAEGLGHAHARLDQFVQRIHLGVLPGGLGFLAAEARALGHGAGLPAAAHLAPFLVLRALLEAALPHVAIDLGAADLAAGAHGVDRGFLAGFEGAEDFVDDAVVDERLEAGRGFHAGGMLRDDDPAGVGFGPSGSTKISPNQESVAPWSSDRTQVDGQLHEVS